MSWLSENGWTPVTLGISQAYGHILVTDEAEDELHEEWKDKPCTCPQYGGLCDSCTARKMLEGALVKGKASYEHLICPFCGRVMDPVVYGVQDEAEELFECEGCGQGIRAWATTVITYHTTPANEKGGPLCPGENCPMCTGEACNKCGAGCWDLSVNDCDHDVSERHEDPEGEKG